MYLPDLNIQFGLIQLTKKWDVAWGRRLLVPTETCISDQLRQRRQVSEDERGQFKCLRLFLRFKEFSSLYPVL